MNSPTDPESASSTPSSGSPPPEEVNFQAAAGSSAGSHFMNIASHISNLAQAAGSSSKRRLPGGSSFASGSSRDPKSRRRGVDHSRATGTSQWEGSLKEGMISGRKEKDELLDQYLVDYIRREVGDPFLEPDIKA